VKDKKKSNILSIDIYRSILMAVYVNIVTADGHPSAEQEGSIVNQLNLNPLFTNYDTEIQIDELLSSYLKDHTSEASKLYESISKYNLSMSQYEKITLIDMALKAILADGITSAQEEKVFRQIHAAVNIEDEILLTYFPYISNLIVSDFKTST